MYQIYAAALLEKGNVEEVLEKQLEREKESAMQKLTTDNLDAMFKITTTLCNMRKMECESIPAVMMDASETLIKKYSNGKYDKNIDALYDEYIAAKMAYQEHGDAAHKDKLMDSVGRLMVEVFDMLQAMILDADFRDERQAIMQQIRKLADS